MEKSKTEYTLRKQDIKSLKDMAYEAIGESILSGIIPAGAKLVETELSKQLNISRGPIREALLHLEQEGLVCSYPYRGTVVAEISAKETEEVYIPIRMIVERYAFRQAPAILAPEDYLDLASLVQGMFQACRKMDTELIARLDSRFHETVVMKCTGPTLRAIWRSLASRISLQIHSQTRCANLSALTAESSDAIAHEHEILLQCVRENNLEKLDALLDEHIRISSKIYSPVKNSAWADPENR